MALDEVFVVDLILKAALAALAVSADDEQLHAGHLVPNRLQQRQQIFVGEDHAVVGVVNNVLEVRR